MSFAAGGAQDDADVCGGGGDAFVDGFGCGVGLGGCMQCGALDVGVAWVGGVDGQAVGVDGGEGLGDAGGGFGAFGEDDEVVLAGDDGGKGGDDVEFCLGCGQGGANVGEGVEVCGGAGVSGVVGLCGQGGGVGVEVGIGAGAVVGDEVGCGGVELLDGVGVLSVFFGGEVDADAGDAIGGDEVVVEGVAVAQAVDDVAEVGPEVLGVAGIAAFVFGGEAEASDVLGGEGGGGVVGGVSVDFVGDEEGGFVGVEGVVCGEVGGGGDGDVGVGGGGVAEGELGVGVVDALVPLVGEGVAGGDEDGA